jgi:hypothetical protein
MSIGTDKLIARLQTRRQGLKHDSLTTIVSTSGGCTSVIVETAAVARALAGSRMRIFMKGRPD